MSPNQEKSVQLRAFGVILILCVGLISWMLLPYAVALVMGGILAMLTAPVYKKLLARRLRPAAAATLVTIGVIVLIVAPAITFSALAVRQAITIGQAVMQKVEGMSLQEFINQLAAWGPIHAVIDNPQELEDVLKQVVQSAGRVVTTQVIELAKSIPNVALQTVLACMGCFFFLIDGNRFVHWLGNRIPVGLEIRGRIAVSFRDTAISVVWASMAAAATQGLLMLLVFAVLRVPAAALAGGATFIFAWIPLLGSGPVWIAGAGWLWFAADAPVRAGIMVAVGILTSLADNVVRPLVLKGRGEMHPLVALVSIFGGIQLFGVFGIFFGPILAALVMTLLQIWPAVGRQAGLNFPADTADPDPAPATPTK